MQKKSLLYPAGYVIILRYNLVLPGELAGCGPAGKLRNPDDIGVTL
jgi:hypothetical protein